jgi:predicted transcriptional regulator
MAKSLFELAAEIVQAQASVSKLGPEDIDSLIKKTYSSLKAVKLDEEGVEEPTPLINAKNSIKQATISCMECGKQFKILSRRHLATHNLSPKEYRAKWGFNPKQPLTCKSLSAKRRRIAKEKNIGQLLKAAREKKAQTRK